MPGVAEIEFRRYDQYRRPVCGQHHRRVFSGAVCARLSLGAPRYCRHRLSKRQGKRRHRPPCSPPDAIPDRTGRIGLEHFSAACPVSPRARRIVHTVFALAPWAISLKNALTGGAPPARLCETPGSLNRRVLINAARFKIRSLKQDDEWKSKATDQTP